MDREIPLHEKRRALRNQIFKYGGITAGVVLALYLLLGFLRTSVKYKDLIVSTVDKGTIEITINASGKVIALTEEIIVSPINSRILEVYKNPGEKVEKGEAILKLELSSIETEYQQKLDEREIKKSKLSQSGLKSDVYVTHDISDDALRIQNGLYYIGVENYEIWVVKNDKAEKRKVKLGESSFEYVEIISGLDSGEQIIISEMNRYRDKNKIKIK